MNDSTIIAGLPRPQASSAYTAGYTARMDGLAPVPDLKDEQLTDWLAGWDAAHADLTNEPN